MLNPLSESDRQLLEAVLARWHTIQDLLVRAEQCGVQTGERGDRHQAHKVIAERLHAKFFPKQMPAIQE
jgi:hypothetical protein